MNNAERNMLTYSTSDTSWPLESCNKCLWCFATNNCTDYPVTWLFPPASVCKLADARWGVCWFVCSLVMCYLTDADGNPNAISLFLCRLDREDEQYARRREESRQRSEER
uniref:Uncharacterized protein n=1 Tax=Periophthalmus magnuspinnatus TaxID=409849 RepID=A0A3B4AEL5_9GOBI